MLIIFRNVLLLFVLCAVVLLPQGEGRAAVTKKLQILASTFPIYQITRNIVAGAEGVEVSLMIPAQLGCPHDHALSPHDMQQLAKADVVILNGLGMEDFLKPALAKLRPGVTIVESAQGIASILPANNEKHDQAHRGKHEEKYVARNPHLFASPNQAALLTENIAKALARQYPAEAATYRANAAAYSQRLHSLAYAFAALGQQVGNKKIVAQQEVFAYLVRDMGLEMVAEFPGHEGQAPVAAEMLDLMQRIRAQHAGALLIETQYPAQLGASIARETGLVAVRLDSLASGPSQAPLDYYEQVMRMNLIALEQALLGR
jgi:zinc transport system substrate-binding protein